MHGQVRPIRTHFEKMVLAWVNDDAVFAWIPTFSGTSSRVVGEVRMDRLPCEREKGRNSSLRSLSAANFHARTDLVIGLTSPGVVI